MFFGPPQIDLTRLAELCRRIGLSLNAGVDIRKVWISEVERAVDSTERAHLEKVRDAVAEGTSMADALAGRTPRKLNDSSSTDDQLREAGHSFRAADAPFEGDGYFPPLVCELVDVGERSGRTDEVFAQLADHYDHVLALRSQFFSAMVWPLLQLFAALAIVGFLIWISGMLGNVAGPRQDQPIDFIGLGLSGTRGVLIYVAILAAIGSAGLIAWTAVERGWLSAAWWWDLVMRVWYVSDCLRAMALARFSWSLSVTHGAGMDARRAMAVALRSTENSWFTRHAAAIDAVLREGHTFHEALAPTGVFPRDFLDALQNAEEAGRISESLARLAVRYDEEAKIASRTLTMVASGLCWALVAGLIILLIFRLFLFYVRTIESFLPK